ncbi:hypothetical protein HPB48_003614 [Haemaphysalis longicornis]|uniref:EF-hand domain-containing protein n=1 Tax=Haemaphysalis longicornis TaxID=44386 RepID=A0A9J6FI05_HAELO|nr:hypothetical protein HPB48_003614 [Haemaphysalis longicornis]
MVRYGTSSLSSSWPVLFQVVSESMLEELKECFMEAYDDNKDGKIEIRELVTIVAFRRIVVVGACHVLDYFFLNQLPDNGDTIIDGYTSTYIG